MIVWLSDLLLKSVHLIVRGLLLVLHISGSVNLQSDGIEHDENRGKSNTSTDQVADFGHLGRCRSGS